MRPQHGSNRPKFGRGLGVFHYRPVPYLGCAVVRSRADGGSTSHRHLVRASLYLCMVEGVMARRFGQRERCTGVQQSSTALTSRAICDDATDSYFHGEVDWCPTQCHAVPGKLGRQASSIAGVCVFDDDHVDFPPLWIGMPDPCSDTYVRVVG